jgi:hypothetical protein
MDFDVIVFIVGALLILGGGAAVVGRELATQEQRRVRRRAEDAVHVILPGIGLLTLLWYTWRSFR